jgi:tetratricopeptide (TPR) repeat protein
MFLVLPKGQSLRAVAERLGVAVEDLQRHTAVKDVDAPAPVEQRLEVPDGFLRSKRAKSELTDAMSSPSGKRGGMNMWLALDIEQKRTRAAGGMKKAGSMQDAEDEALEEALTAYLRFEAASNDLAADLYQQITATISTEVRGRAFAGLSCAQAQRHLIFGDTPERCRPSSLSSAKAAQLADPKLAEGHLGMALALQIQGALLDFDEARDELDRAVRLNPKAHLCHVERARLELRVGNRDAARQAADAALAINPDSALALEADAHLRLHAGDRAGAIAQLKKATIALPTYADSWAFLATLEQGDNRVTCLEAARTNATSPNHLKRLEESILRGV